MLKKIRTALAALFILGITALFLDFTGTLHAWLGWMARIQFLPALLALNLGIVAALVIVTLLFGRVYCSVICPLGVMQDGISNLSGRRQGKRYRFSYSKPLNLLRYTVLALFIVAFIAGIGSFTSLLAPYSAYGRIVQNLLSPIYLWVNNSLAYTAERMDSYAFYTQEIWIRSIATFIIAVATLLVTGFLAWRHGRTYCNTVCPVGTILGFLSRFSLFAPVIDKSKCNACGLCAKGCKSSCIDSKTHSIDLSRCVACFDCVDTCRHSAISYTLRPRRKVGTPVGSAPSSPTSGAPESESRRAFFVAGAAAAGAAMMEAQHKTVDGGLAAIVDKVAPHRNIPIVPPGAQGLRHFRRHCTGCQFCVAACPNGVLRPSTSLSSAMQPCSSYERGYCRPECTRCSDVCPTGAIHKIDRAEKSSIRIGHAVWVKENCVPLHSNGVECGACARHCPTGAITMVPYDPDNLSSIPIPAINEEKCIGCGACENLCPARPFSAIYVEGHLTHSTL